jgi:alginate O-acetyltransferase complex protein AlgJ
MAERLRSARAATARRSRVHHVAVPLVAALAVAVGLLALPSVQNGAAATSQNVVNKEVPGTAGPFVGIDGLFYNPADFIVEGQGELFIGQDFDMLCGAGKSFDRGVHRLAELASIIEKSGRRALFALAPDKSSVDTAALPSPLPHGECDAAGMQHQQEVLDHDANPQYVQVRKQLTRTPYSYWKTDAHWNTVGASVYAEQVARKLSPKLARKQKFNKTTRTEFGDLVNPVDNPTPETAPARLPANGVTMSPAPGEPTYDPTLKHIYLELSWNSGPARKVWPGRTLFLGDSFTYTALESLGNLVRHGRFLWLGYHSNDELADAIKDSDTVVITVVQRFASVSQAQSPSLLRTVKQALRSRR